MCSTTLRTAMKRLRQIRSFMAVFIHAGRTGRRHTHTAPLAQSLKTGHTHVMSFRPTVSRSHQTIPVGILGDLNSQDIPALFPEG
jgi:undecaprenyl pyrophosphate phosphatase UppP